MGKIVLPVTVRLFLLGVCLLFALKVNAQTCTGSLGDPVINQTFGAGQNPGPALGSGITTMTYTTNNCPNDGQYTIANSLTGSGNCHTDTWHNVTADHTGNPNGYMMIVNASEQASVFFTQTASGLCPNTTYEFSSYILNLITRHASISPGVSEPNITFSITTTSGQVLAIDSTGTIPNYDSPVWTKYGTYFTTPANVTDVIVTMRNNAPGGNGNDLILDDIAFRPCGPVIQTGFGSVTGPMDEEICQGNNANYLLTATVTGGNNPAYQWQSNFNGNGWVDIAGQTTDSLFTGFVNAAPGSYQYRLGVDNGSNISSAQCRAYSPPLSVNVNPLPVVPAIAQQTVCEGNMLELTASGGANYVWSGPNLPPTSQNPLIIANVTTANAGTYMVQVTSASGCAAPPVQAVVKVLQKVVAGISNDVAICAGSSAMLSASGGLYYKWSPSTGLDNDSIPNPTASPLQTTTYSVNVSNDGCNDNTKSVTVTVYQDPFADAGSNKVIFEGQSVKLTGTVTGDNISSYYWTPATGLDSPNALTPIASPTDNTTYTLNVVSQSCGTASSAVFVRVYKKVTVPNTFSPNNDGINDNWDIDALVTYPESTLMVFDRYGQQVYQSVGYSTPWNGTFNGTPLPTGTYYYIIDLKNGTPKITGWVLILR